MSMFHVGDRVVAVVNYPDGNESINAGKTGTVCVIDDRIGVCWDDPVDGHSCDYRGEEHCEFGYGWWMYEEQIELEQDDGTLYEFDEEAFRKLLFGEAM